MTCEEFYGDAYAKLTAAATFLDCMAEEIRSADLSDADLKPVVYHCLRIKQPDSMIRKLRERGLPVNRDSALTNLYDALGLRIVCAFAEDVYSVANRICERDGILVAERKDYFDNPKPNGYRSLHLCVYLPAYDINAEIQIRTIAMDFWATLEHQMQYKKCTVHEKLIRDELKRCADEIASLDLSMQTIREILREDGDEKMFGTDTHLQ